MGSAGLGKGVTSWGIQIGWVSSRVRCVYESYVCISSQLVEKEDDEP